MGFRLATNEADQREYIKKNESRKESTALGYKIRQPRKGHGAFGCSHGKNQEPEVETRGRKLQVNRRVMSQVEKEPSRRYPSCHWTSPFASFLKTTVAFPSPALLAPALMTQSLPMSPCSYQASTICCSSSHCRRDSLLQQQGPWRSHSRGRIPSLWQGTPQLRYRFV